MISMSPLWWRGKPYTAGLNGMKKDDIRVHLFDDFARFIYNIGNILEGPDNLVILKEEVQGAVAP